MVPILQSKILLFKIVANKRVNGKPLWWLPVPRKQESHCHEESDLLVNVSFRKTVLPLRGFASTGLCLYGALP
ncbi:MAG: hypothetical protein OXM55_06655, partial [Bdellovibrionales bacterium]|nr:hypothetical protein [Bdellovibrionales bacterium]